MKTPRPKAQVARASAILALLAASAVSLFLPRPDARPQPRKPSPAVSAAAAPAPPPAEGREPIRITGPTHPMVVVLPETTYFGGTVWAPDSGRWEAMEGGTWTFDSGVGSPKEGWRGVDASRSTTARLRRLSASDPRWESSPCVGAGAGLGGQVSFWCGVFTSEAESLCFVAGRGYGNDWRICIVHPFTSSGGNLGIAFDMAVDTEQDYDFATVEIDTAGAGDPADVVTAAAYDGQFTGRDSLVLAPGLDVSGGGDMEFRFCFESDGAWSDEDGIYPTDCGAFAVDDVRVSGGGITYFTDFETDDGGWTVVSEPGLGDLSRLVDVAGLPDISGVEGCSVQDSVLVFFDPDTGGHPDGQSNYAVSPWIDLERAGASGLPGKTILLHEYLNLPFLNYVFSDVRIQWNQDCITEPPRIGQFEGLGSFFTSNTPTCFGFGNEMAVNLSSVVPQGVTEVRLAVGVVNLCFTEPSCTGLSNTSPWFDNIRLAVHSFSTIQAAIDSAAPGDTVWIPPGTFTGKGNRDLTFRGKNLVLKSVSGPEATVIDCQGLGHGFLFESGEDSTSVVDGFTIRAGNASADTVTSRRNGGGIYLDAASPRIRNCVIELCRGEYGGGIYGTGNPTLDSCTVTGCQATIGGVGGIQLLPGLTMTNCTISANAGLGVQTAMVTMTDCTVSANGGGVYTGVGYIQRCDFTDNTDLEGIVIQQGGVIEDCRILRNQSGGIGGYADQFGCGGVNNPLYRNCLIDGNAGGGVIARCLTLDSCTVSNNTGGGVVAQFGAVLTACTITGNTATQGGGVRFFSGGGAFVTPNSASGCTISGNTATYGGGVAVTSLCESQAGVSISDCLITGNVAERGGGIYVFENCPPGDTASVAGCTIASNTAKTGGGAHIDKAAVRFANTILWGNCADSTAAGIFLEDPASLATLACSALEAAEVDGPGTLAYEDAQVFQDPLFCTPASCSAAPTTAGDYGLGQASPCLPAVSPCGTLIGARGQACGAVPVRIAAFTAAWEGDGAVVQWTVTDASGIAGFHVYRQQGSAEREQITETLLTGDVQYVFRDASAPRDGADYWLAAVGRTGAVDWFGPASLPAYTVSPGLFLAPNRPNPFAAGTHIAFRTPESGRVLLTVHDLAGREVARLVDAVLPAGDHVAAWDGATRAGGRAPAGVYLLRLWTGHGTRSHKMLKLE